MKTLNHTMTRRRAGTWLGTLPLWSLAACASLPGHEPLRVSVVGIEGLKGEGLELRFAVKLRLQNPNDTPIDYDGIALDLDLDGKVLASGVSPDQGSVPRFGEVVVTVPVSISAFAAIRQALGMVDGAAHRELPYALRGRLSSSGLFGSVRFSAEGSLKLPQ